MKGMTFDQVERYRGAGLVLEALVGRNTETPVRVLDLGGYFKTLDGTPLLPLQVLHPELDTVVADVSPCDLPGYHRLDPGQPLPFETGQFRITLCMDVLEHIHPDHRNIFLDDAFRVTSGAVIMAAPFYHPARDASDRWLAQFLDRVLETPNPMLQEHLANGLPDPSTFETYLSTHQLPSVRFSNGHLGAWHLVMAIKHLLLLSSGTEASLAFETETLPWAMPVTLDGPGYRDVYVVLKDPSLSPDPIRTALDTKTAEIRNMRRRELGDSLETVCSRHLQVVGESLREFSRVVDARDASLRNIQMDRLRLERALRLTRIQMERSTEHMRKLDLVIREKNRVIDELLAREQLKDQEFSRHIRAYEEGLQELRSSAAYRTGSVLLAPLKAGMRAAGRVTASGKTPGERDAGPAEDGLAASESGGRDLMDLEGQVLEKAVADPRISTLSHAITFSILVPVYNTDEDLLKAMIDSVLAQTYPRWQLCLADDASPGDTPRRVIESYARREP